MVNARNSHGNAYAVFISPEGWWTLAGGNTPDSRPTRLRPGRALESILHPIRPISPIRPIPPHLRVSASQPLPTWSALIKNHNVVPSFSPGLAARRPTPGKLPHKIQPLISRDCGPREARIRTPANLPKIQNSTLKIQHSLPHPPTHPHPKSTLTNPKSTVDLGCEELIKVDNGLSTPFFPTRCLSFCSIKTRHLRSANQTKTATCQKIYPASRLIQVKTPALEFRSFSGAWRLVPGAFATVARPQGPKSQTLIHRNFSFQGVSSLFKGIQAYSREFKPIQAFLPASFFIFMRPSQKTPPRRPGRFGCGKDLVYL